MRVAGRKPPNFSMHIPDPDIVTIDGQPLPYPHALHVLLHKPLGYVCSRRRDTPQTQIVYDLLPPSFLHRRPPVVVAGRLDKWASGLVLMSQDGPPLFPCSPHLFSAYFLLSPVP